MGLRYSAEVIGLAMMLALRVVLDPGHGGSETGAPGAAPGLVEKLATLSYAQRVKAALEANGIEVVMTRHSDEAVPIRARVRKAADSGGEAFVSIHLNASPLHNQRGFECYVLEAEDARREAAEMALRLEAQAGGAPAGVQALVATLGDLRQEGVERRSIRLGRKISAYLGRARGYALDRGLKQSSLDILKGHRMPAVLVEIGFIDNLEEGPMLSMPEKQEEIAEALAQAIREYLQEANKQ